MKLHLLPTLFASEAISVDLDPTVVAQLVLFATFIIFLKPLLFDPLLRVFEAREERTEGEKRRAREMDAKAAEFISKYERELEEIRRQAGVERERLRAERDRIEAQLMLEARAETARMLEEGKARVAAEVERMREELRAGQPELARQIASQLLDREVRP